jgi:hypothetical protein
VNQAGLAASCARLAALQIQAGKPAEALRSLDQAVPLLERATGEQPEDCIFRQTLASVHAERARLLAKSDAIKAVQSARQAVDLIEELAADETAFLFDLACHRALLSSLLGPKGAEAEQRAAVAALQKAVREAGYDNVYPLRTDPRLAPLRPRTDFRALLRQLEEKRKVGAGGADT